MALELNQFRVNIIEEDIEDDLEVVEEFEAQAQANIEDENLNHKMTRAYTMLGYLFYQQEEFAASQTNFIKAATTGAREFFYKPAPTEPHQTRNAWSFYRALHISTCFGRYEDIELMLQTEEIKYHNYPDEPTLNRFLADTIAVVKSYLFSNTIDPTALTNLIEAAQHSSRNKEEQTFVVPMVNGLAALVNDDQTAWQAAIEASLEGHLREVKMGDYRRSEQGFISMPGLALVKLGQAKGWHTDIDSLYLPTQLLALS